MPTLVKNKNWMNEFMTLKTQYNLNNITEETLIKPYTIKNAERVSDRFLWVNRLRLKSLDVG